MIIIKIDRIISINLSSVESSGVYFWVLLDS